MTTSTPASAAATTARCADAVRDTTTNAWSAGDEAFFRLVRELFPPAFLRGGSVLLASYDPEPDPA